ncbi:MAG: hypothetical protein E7240_00745 [Lachnospiraceae bacterium]|nr:hypothetical protein [Lachnospiraceae bacterium]
MNRFQCDSSYLTFLKDYSEQIVARVGVFSPSAEREVLCMSDAGNTVASKLFGDLIFYKKILRRDPYRDAFDLYMKAAAIAIREDGSWECGAAAFPLSFWSVGYYLVNYHRDSFLRTCEEIPLIDGMTLSGRFGTALELAISCIDYTGASEAVNLVGRILAEIAGNEELYRELESLVRENAAARTFSTLELTTGKCESCKDCAALSKEYFRAAAQAGYVYACNNLAVAEAEEIVRLSREAEDTGAGKIENLGKEAQAPGAGASELSGRIENYIHYLTIAADKYEPYAANRLGLFYKTGEIRCSAGKVYCKLYINSALAKEYFLKATVYPDSNSAWAYFNLLKHYPLEYDQNLELMGEYMDTIKVLNPEVYDLVLDL